MGKGRTKGAKAASTPKKALISHDYQALGGSKTCGAAAAVAGKRELSTKNGATQVKLLDAQIRGGVASRLNRRSSGRPKDLASDAEKKTLASSTRTTPKLKAKPKK
jgi:hypothetical protein